MESKTKISKQRTISLKEGRDVAIAQWGILAKDTWGGLSFFAKRAIRKYMKDGGFECIGKIHLPKDAKRALSLQPSISLWFGDCPDIIEWMMHIQSMGMSSATLIREILRKSIQIVPEEEEEWIPNLLDLDVGILDTAQWLRDKENASQKVPVDQGSQVAAGPSPEPNKTDGRTEPAVNAIPERAMEEQTRTDSKKKNPPRALALSGKHFEQ